MSYVQQQRRLAMAWKARTETLPDEARAAAPYVGKGGEADGPAYPFCLPPQFAVYNLLPDLRESSLALFAELGIPWHAGVGTGPSNHLLSSQVQCVNALGRMVRDPERVRAGFGRVIEVGEVLPVEPGRYLTFEYIGPTDFFGEARGGHRVRGAHCTSVDAAFRHRVGGAEELVLVEWKYTEWYEPDPQRARKEGTRRLRYAAAVDDPEGPVRGGLLPFEALLEEPLYQLVRQQLLAHALERAGVADRVRVVHVLPRANDAYQRSLARAPYDLLGSTVSEVWASLLRRPERFTTMDPAVLLDPAVTSAEYASRYRVTAG